VQEPAVSQSFIRVFVLVAVFLVSGAASAADIKVLISAGFFKVYSELGPAFEKSTGHKLVTTRGPSAIRRKRSRPGWRAAKRPTW